MSNLFKIVLFENLCFYTKLNVMNRLTLILISIVLTSVSSFSQNRDWPVLKHYDQNHLLNIALPLGGIGTGTVSLGGRGELRDRREGNEAHLGQRHRGADHPVIGIGHCQHQDDGKAADQDQRLAHVLVHRGAFHLAAQQQRHDEVVAHHDGERDALDDHHGSGGRKPAEEGDEREGGASGMHGQRQHEGVAVGTRRQQQQACDGDGNDEDVDRHQIEREQPGGALHLAGIGVLHRRHMELARQEDHREGGKQREGQPLPAVQPTGEQAHHLRVRRGALEEGADAAHHPEHHEQAHRQEGDELDH